MSKNPTPFKEKLLDSALIYRIYLWQKNAKNTSKHQMDMVYKEKDLTQEFYEKVKNTTDQELEHQIGRLINYKNIVKECENIDGHVIEFGTWKGFSLLWIAYFIERNGMFNKKIIGLDGFAGLPYADGSFRKYAFSDTSLKECRRNVLGSKHLYNITKKNIHIKKFLFNQHEEIPHYLKNKQADSFCFIHIDCDVSQSAKEIFSLLENNNLIAKKAYILFDDYGCDTEQKETIDNIFKKMSSTWNIQEHSKTKLTKNFVFTKK